MPRSLLFFSSPVPQPPTFVIPVFSHPGTNQVCVQDLNGTGEIVRFLPFAPGQFFSPQVMPPNRVREEGDQGLLGFWKSEDEIVVGTMTEMRAQLADVDQSSLKPFAAVELMMLMDNSEGLKAAANRAAELIASPTGKATYVARVEDRVRALATLQDIDSRDIPEGVQTLAGLLAELQTSITPTAWNRKWIAGMNRYNEDSKLISIAGWRLKDAGPAMKEYEIVGRLTVSDNVECHYIAHDWLRARGPTWLGYSSIWLSMSRFPLHPFDDLTELGLDYLRQGVLNPRRSHSWSTIWSRLWKLKADRTEMLDLAHRAAQSTSPTQDSFIELVLMPIVDETDVQSWAVESIVRWLRNPRGYRVWVINYIRFGHMLDDNTRTRVASIWLRSLGNGMNLWRDLWIHTKELFDPNEHIELAELWLIRARKDLRSWPDVFAEVMRHREDNVSKEIVAAAREWVVLQKGSKSNKLIESIADLSVHFDSIAKPEQQAS